jgi:cation diffusion facilitator family transporter
MQIKELTAHQAVFIISLLCSIAGFVVGGVLGSPAVLNDAGHMLCDSLGFGIVLISFYYSKRKTTLKYTYGMQKLEALGALLTLYLLVIVSGIVYYISALRFEALANGSFEFHSGWPILGMGLASLVANAIMAIILSLVNHQGSSHSHNHGHSHGHTHDEEAIDEVQISGVISASISIRMINKVDHLVVTPTTNSSWSKVRIEINRENKIEVLNLDYNGLFWISREKVNKPYTFSAQLIVQKYQQEPVTAIFEMMERPEIRWSTSFRNSFIHILGHLVQSAGVILVGLLILFMQDSTSAQLSDPIIGIISATISLALTGPVTRSSIRILLDSAPNRIPMKNILKVIKSIPSITSVHDLHFWRVKSGKHCLTAHIRLKEHHPSNILMLLHQATSQLGIQHSTFQLETGDVGYHHHEDETCGVSWSSGEDEEMEVV